MIDDKCNWEYNSSSVEEPHQIYYGKKDFTSLEAWIKCRYDKI